jgi:hypothetical protein
MMSTRKQHIRLAPAKALLSALGFAFCGLLSLAVAATAHAQALFADGFEGNCGIASYSTSFSNDGASWPAPWVGVGGVALSDVQAGRARLRPVPTGVRA